MLRTAVQCFSISKRISDLNAPNLFFAGEPIIPLQTSQFEKALSVRPQTSRSFRVDKKLAGVALGD